MKMLAPQTPQEAARFASEHARVEVLAAQTKLPAGSLHGGAVEAESDLSEPVAIDPRPLRGILEYEPTEYTVTLRAGTPVAELVAALTEEGQYLPFDPLWVDQGATIGGTIAAGISGPGLLRHGSLRDFVLGIQFVDGRGELARGGGKVVKNAAGFDLPKLMVGSCGWYGLLTEVTLKVFPRPAARRTLRIEAGELGSAVARVGQMLRKPIDVEAVELHSDGRVLIRIAGASDALEGITARIAAATESQPKTLSDAEAAAYWEPIYTGGEAAGNQVLVRCPLTLSRVGPLQAALPDRVVARYSAAGNTAWLAVPDEDCLAALDRTLTERSLAWQAFGGRASLAGRFAPGVTAFARRIKSALDPQHRFGGPLDRVHWMEPSGEGAR